MASAYWRVDDVEQIGERQIEIPSENGLSYTSGQKISLFIPPSVEVMDGANTYLNFDLKIKQPAGGGITRLQLDEAGGGILFKNLRIYDGTRGNLLEELNEYSSLVALKHSYDTDESLRSVRAMTEGGTCYNQSNRGTKGSSKSAYADTLTNPYFKRIDTPAAITDSATELFTTVKCTVPIHSGIFSGSVFPVMMSSGLYLEWDLEPAPRVVKQLDSVLKDRRLPLNPVYQGETVGADVDWAGDGSALTTLFVSKDNNLSGKAALAKFPFLVGESIGFIKSDGTEESDLQIGLTVVITSITITNDFIVVGFASTQNSTTVDIVSGQYSLYSKAVGETADLSTYDVEYTVSNFNMVVQEIILDPAFKNGMLQKAMEGKAIEFDITSVTNYKNSLLASDRQTNFHVHANNSKAKSLICSVSDSSVYTSAQLVSSDGTYEITKDSMDVKLNSNRSGYTGVCDFLASYQMLVDGKLVPSRPVSTRKIATRESIDAFHLYEMEKSLDNAGITPRSFGDFMNNFIVSRGFSVLGGATDLRGKDLSVNLRYDMPRITKNTVVEERKPTKPKIINSFVFHIRRLMLRGNGAVEVIV